MIVNNYELFCRFKEAENSLRFYRNAKFTGNKDECQRFDQELAKITQFMKQKSVDGEGVQWSDFCK